MLAGDKRLVNKLRHDELIPLGSRIRTRLATEYAPKEELMTCLQHLMTQAGNATLLSQGLTLALYWLRVSYSLKSEQKQVFGETEELN